MLCYDHVANIDRHYNGLTNENRQLDSINNTCCVIATVNGRWLTPYLIQSGV